jgi:hypothetical protein
VQSLERPVLARSVVGSAVVVATGFASSARASAAQRCAVGAAQSRAQAMGAAASAVQSLRTRRFAPAAEFRRERAYKRRALAQGQCHWCAQNARVSAGEQSLALEARRTRMKA